MLKVLIEITNGDLGVPVGRKGVGSLYLSSCGRFILEEEKEGEEVWLFSQEGRNDGQKNGDLDAD